MPPEWYAIDGARLVKDLRARRDGLPEVAEEFYLHLAKKVDVYLTHRSERIDAVRTPGGDMEVSVRSRSALGPAGSDHVPPRVPRERDRRGALLRAGRRRLLVPYRRRSGARACAWSEARATTRSTRRGSGKAKLSDSDGRNRALAADLDDHPYHAPPPPKNAPWIPPRDFTRETWGTPLAAYNADLGVFLGYAVQHQRYDFRKSPYASSHRVSGGWAFGQEGGRVDYLGDFRRENRSSYFSLHGLRLGDRGAPLLRLRQRDRGSGEPGLLQGARDAVRRCTLRSACPSPGSGS